MYVNTASPPVRPIGFALVHAICAVKHALFLHVSQVLATTSTTHLMGTLLGKQIDINYNSAWAAAGYSHGTDASKCVIDAYVASFDSGDPASDLVARQPSFVIVRTRRVGYSHTYNRHCM